MLVRLLEEALDLPPDPMRDGILIGRGLAGSSLPKVLFATFGIVAGIIALTALANWWLASRRRKSGRAPRARVRWLRPTRTPFAPSNS